MDVTRYVVFLIASLAAAILLRWLIKSVRRWVVLPAGPWGLPLLGYAPFLGSQPHIALFELSKKYGKVFSVTLGNDTVVVLNSWESVKASLVDQPKAFSGRPELFIFKVLSEQRDVGFSDGPTWKKQRQLNLQVNKSVGIGQKEMETRVMDMVSDVLATLNKADGKIQPMSSIFFVPIAKLLWRILTGDDIDEFDEYVKAVSSLVKLLQTDGRQIFNTFPWLRFVPPNGLGHWDLVRAKERLSSFLKRVVDQNVSNFKEGNVNGLIDHCLDHLNNQYQDSKQQELPITLEDVFLSVWVNSVAGIETTSTTCLWGVLFLALHPEVQAKAQVEMDEVVGRHRLPNLNDSPRLPYNNALVMEIHRKSSMVALSLPHRATETTQVLGHTIPKDTTVIQNIYAIHHDPELWDEPEAFRPERFIDENNKAKAPPYLMPFSVGPRTCIGQPLVDMELKLLFYCLIHQFNFSLPPNEPPPSLIPDVSVNLTPLPFSLLCNKRKE